MKAETWYPDAEEVSSLLPVHGFSFRPSRKGHISQSSLISHKEHLGIRRSHGLSNPRGTRFMQLLLDDNTSGSDFLALMMPTRRYLRSARIVTHKHCSPHAQFK